MPRITARTVDRLIAAYNPVEGRSIIVPTYAGKRGNPVLWDRRFFAEMTDLKGDVGARHLIGAHAEAVTEVRSAEHTSELQSLMRISYAVFCLKKKTTAK